MTDDLENFILSRKNRLKTIIDGLKDYEPFRLLLEEKKKAVEFSDSNWHLIDLNDKDKLLELKYNKLAAEAFINCIRDFQAELESYDVEEENEYE